MIALLPGAFVFVGITIAYIVGFIEGQINGEKRGFAAGVATERARRSR